jgi:hypothetical protein
VATTFYAITGLESLFCLSAIHRVSEALARHVFDV